MLLLASPAIAVWLVVRVARGKSSVGWRERWGHLPAELREKREPRVWVHAASVGEVNAVTPILQAYRRRRPGDGIVMSVVTPGGHEVAERLKGTLLAGVCYAPFDLPWAVRRAVGAVQPDLYVGVETELWPNAVHHVASSGARLALVNGRISDRSIGSYRRCRILFRWVLGHFDRLLARSDADAQRLREVGAPSGRVAVLGNSKLDQAPEPLPAGEVDDLRRALRLPDGAPVLIVASTRTAEEDRLVLRACHRLRESAPDIAFVYAPRHVERAPEVEALMRAQGMEPVRRSTVDTATGPVRDLVLDTFGELARVYAVADVAFVGNSLVAPGGGQNVLQPLAQGVPVVYGPYTQNFRDIMALVEAAGLGTMVRGEDELASVVLALLHDCARRRALGTAAKQMIAANRGVSERYADELVALMAKGRCGHATV